jgi:hypothetical protein
MTFDPFVERRQPAGIAQPAALKLCNKRTSRRICLNLRYLSPPGSPYHGDANRSGDGVEYRRKTMAKAGQGGLEAIVTALPRGERKGPPPVHLWNPPFCGDIDMRIATDGTWFYQKTPIGRLALVKLFASVLKREGDKYFLVTPVEKVGITVDDVPFMAVEMTAEDAPGGQVLNFRTNVDDWVGAGADHALRFEPETGTGGLKPYLHVRRDLWAKVTRALFYDLVERGEEREVGGKAKFGVASGGGFFVMADASAVREFA